jgi:hypothetical protein
LRKRGAPGRSGSLKFLSQRSVQTLPPLIQAPVDAVALAIHPAIDPVSAAVQPAVDTIAPAIQGPGQVLVASCLCAVGSAVQTVVDTIAPAIHPAIDAIAAAVQTVVDAVALSIQAVFDPLAFCLGLSLRKGYPKCEKEHSTNGYDFLHLPYLLIRKWRADALILYKRISAKGVDSRGFHIQAG